MNWRRITADLPVRNDFGVVFPKTRTYNTLVPVGFDRNKSNLPPKKSLRIARDMDVCERSRDVVLSFKKPKKHI